MKKFRQFLCTSFVWLILAPWMITFTGEASNQLVLIANQDKFPVMINAVKLDELRNPPPSLLGMLRPAPRVTDDGMIDEIHCIMTNKTHLNFLADVFDLHESIYSIGDLMLMLGEWLWSFVPLVWVTLVLKKFWDENVV